MRNEKGQFVKGHKIRKGMKQTKETKKKISLANFGHKGFWKGKKLLETAKEKMSLAKKGKYIGKNSPSWKGGKPKCAICGKELTSYTAELCYPCFAKLNKGENHYNWQGGKSIEPYSIDWTKTLKRSIKERDRFACQICGEQEDLSVHHIDYNKKNCNPDNLITLCRSCHTKTNYKRKKWIKFFEKHWKNITLLGSVLILSYLTKGLGLSALPFIFFRGDTFGHSPVGASWNATGLDRLRGADGATDGAGVADSVTMWVKQYSTKTPNIKGYIFLQSNDNYIGKTDQWTMTTGYEGEKTINFTSGPDLLASTHYVVAINTSDTYYCYTDSAVNPPANEEDTYTYNRTGNATLIEQDRITSIYATYAPSGGEVNEGAVSFGANF